MERRGSWIRLIYALCLTGATINHVRAVAARGWLPEQLPVATALYWSSLTFLDPLAVILLCVRPRAGVGLTVAIIVSDVAHNLWFTATHPLRTSFIQDIASSAFLMSQIAFLIFVGFTAPLAWRSSKQSAQPA